MITHRVRSSHTTSTEQQFLQGSRAAWLCISLAIASTWCVTRMLSPDPRGFGTHTQLGLPACWFLQVTGLPCPACGLTTSFALVAHGELRAALACHPLGALTFALACALLPACMYAAVRGIAFSETWTRLRAPRVCVILACAALAQWLVRTACLLHG